LRRDPIDIDTGIGEECTGIVDLVDAPGVELDVHEAGGPRRRRVLVVAKRASHASDPELHAAAHLCRHVSSEDDVRDGEASIRLQHSARFAEHRDC
jgi:hypothetical protein